MPSVSDILHEYRAVVITGGSSGLGHSFLSLLDTIGYSGLICNLSRQKPELKNVESALKHFPCDLERFEEIEENCKSLIDFLEKNEGPILLINNSGFGGYGCFPGPNLEHNLSMVDLNARAPLHLTGRLLPLLEVRGGAVVNIASTAAFQPTPFLATYGATKAFLLHWSLSLYEDLKPKGIHVLSVCPGPTKTNFFKRAGFDEPTVSDVFSQSADAVIAETVRALKERRALVVTGWFNKCLVALSGLLPKTWALRLSALILSKVRN